jgi:TonB-dependent SusC/RagA subfamily outer membrane receptor
MKPNNILLLIFTLWFSLTASAQNSGKGSDKPIDITGKVLTLDQMPVEGAVFYIDNFKTNFKSNNKGSYKIKVSPSAYKLSVRSSEYGSCDTIINGKTTINFTLSGSSKPQKKQLAETKKEENGNTGYGSLTENNQSSRFNKLEGGEIKNSQYQNVYEMLNGTVPGVQVHGNKITIRGQSSFYGSNEPLFVVDGLIVTSIDDVIPREVKSIQVLKASSAAIYGSRGSNGVIVITRIKPSEKK